MAFSHDGAQIAWWASREKEPSDGVQPAPDQALGIVAIDGRQLLSQTWPLRGHVAAVDFDPSGSGELAVAEWIDQEGSRPQRGRVRILSAGGRAMRSWDLDDYEAPMAVFFMAEPPGIWVTSSCASRFISLDP